MVTAMVNALLNLNRAEKISGRLKNIEPSSILNQGFNCFSSLYIFAEKGAKGIGTSSLLKMSPGNSNSNLNHP